MCFHRYQPHEKQCCLHEGRKAKCDDLLGPPGKSFGKSSRKAEEIQASNGNLREQNAASLDV